MATAIAVSYRKYAWAVTAVRALGVVALLGGILLWTTGEREARWGASILAPAGLAALVVNEVIASRQRAARRSVIDTGSGFRWLGGPVDLEVEDGQVVAVRLSHTPVYSSGLYKASIRRFETWIDGLEKPLRMTNRIEADTVDPLAPLVDRILEDLKQRTAAGLATGGALEGEGWRLAAHRLTIIRGRNERELAFSEVDCVAVFDKRLCVWLKGESEPAAKIDPGSKNAPVLGSLLHEWCQHQTVATTDEDTVDDENMGRLLFERAMNSWLWLGLFLAFAALVLGLFVIVAGEAPLPGIATIGGSAILAAVALLLGRGRFRCYERGICRQLGRNQRRMRYLDVFQFDYSSTRMFHNGVYSGTISTLLFRSPAGKIFYHASTRNSDVDMDELRDHIAKVIAGRMLRELQAGNAVAWGNDTVFRPEGFEFRRAKLLGTAPPEIIPYEAILGVDLQQGHFHLFRKGESRSTFTKPVSSPNFFPGFYLLLTLLNPSEATAAGQGAESASPAS